MGAAAPTRSGTRCWRRAAAARTAVVGAPHRVQGPAIAGPGRIPGRARDWRRVRRRVAGRGRVVVAGPRPPPRRPHRRAGLRGAVCAGGRRVAVLGWHRGVALAGRGLGSPGRAMVAPPLAAASPARPGAGAAAGGPGCAGMGRQHRHLWAGGGRLGAVRARTDRARQSVGDADRAGSARAHARGDTGEAAADLARPPGAARARDGRQASGHPRSDGVPTAGHSRLTDREARPVHRAAVGRRQRPDGAARRRHRGRGVAALQPGLDVGRLPAGRHRVGQVQAAGVARDHCARDERRRYAHGDPLPGRAGRGVVVAAVGTLDVARRAY